MVKQDIQITNSDPTTHNIHFTPKSNPDWNQSQPNGAPPLMHKVSQSEVLVPVKCNQHPWMKSYIGVLKHPFFAVSAEDGTFTIKGVPPGTYTVVALARRRPDRNRENNAGDRARQRQRESRLCLRRSGNCERPAQSGR